MPFKVHVSALLAFCGLVSAAEVMDPASAEVGKLPAGWRAYITGPKETRAASGAVEVREIDGGKVLLIEDKSDKHEYGVCRTVPCREGDYFRITAVYRPAADGTEVSGTELTAHFVPAQKFRAGAIHPTGRGVAVLDTVRAPQGTRALQIYFYSQYRTKTAFLIESLRIETSRAPFPDTAARPPIAFPGKTYYLSPSGNDAAAGTRNAPFRSIGRVNAALTPGDTAVFLPGEYGGAICPARSGAPDAPITYRAERSGTAVLTGPDGGGYAAMILDRENIVLEGFRFKPKPQTRWLMVDGSRNCRFRDLVMRDSDIHNPVRCQNSSYLRFSDIVAAGCRHVGANGILAGDMWNNYNVTHSVYERMYISQVGHRPFGLWYDCENIVVRDVVFDCRWGRNFEFFSPKKLLMERCVVTNAFEGSGSMDGTAKLYPDDSIVRYNLVLRNGYKPVGTGGYQFADLPRFTSRNSRYYFNTFYRNEDAAWTATGDNVDLNKTCYRNNIIKNNIFSENDFDKGTAFGTGVAAYTDCRVRRNLFWGGRPGAKTIFFWPGLGKSSLYLTPEEAEKQAKPYFEDNLEGDPKFADADRDNFLPTAGPALDGGEHLTTTTAAGKNTTFLPVADCRYFYDGFRIPGEKGDAIVIGPQKTPARIVHISVWQNTITLDRRVSFEKGDTVDLPYAGKAPDLGAYEANMAKPTGPVYDPARIRLQSDPDILLVSDFEANDPDSWFHLWNISRSAQSYGFLDKTTAATGKQSWRIEYVPYETLRKWTMLSPSVKDLDSLLTTHLSPAWWRIADHPMLRFAYRVPKGVPMCVTLYCGSRAAAPGPASVVVAQTPAVKAIDGYVRKPLVALTDDDAWHTVEIDLRKLTQVMPELRYVYKLRFWAGGNFGKPGMRYWLDDVSIKAK